MKSLITMFLVCWMKLQNSRGSLDSVLSAVVKAWAITLKSLMLQDSCWMQWMAVNKDRKKIIPKCLWRPLWILKMFTNKKLNAFLMKNLILLTNYYMRSNLPNIGKTKLCRIATHWTYSAYSRLLGT